MVFGKYSSNPLMANNLLKVVWYSTHHVVLMKSWLVQKQTALGVNTPRCDKDRLELIELTVFLFPKVEKVGVEFWTTVAVKKVNDVTRLQALMDKKKENVFANIRRVGKGFSEVETPLFEGMVVAQEVGEGVDNEVHDEGVLAAGVATEGVVSAANDKVPTADEEPSIPSPTPPTPPPQPSHDIPSTS
nr:hypothetical protein [Tanacetum cinerariifolium]